MTTNPFEKDEVPGNRPLTGADFDLIYGNREKIDIITPQIKNVYDKVNKPEPVQPTP